MRVLVYHYFLITICDFHVKNNNIVLYNIVIVRTACYQNLNTVSPVICRYWEGTDVCIMLEDIDFVCDVVRILMQACTDNGNSFVASESHVPIFFSFFQVYLSWSKL